MLGLGGEGELSCESPPRASAHPLKVLLSIHHDAQHVLGDEDVHRADILSMVVSEHLGIRMPLMVVESQVWRKVSECSVCLVLMGGRRGAGLLIVVLLADFTVQSGASAVLEVVQYRLGVEPGSVGLAESEDGTGLSVVAADAVKRVWVESRGEVVSEGDVAEAAMGVDAKRGLGEIMAGSASSAIVNLVSHASMSNIDWVSMEWLLKLRAEDWDVGWRKLVARTSGVAIAQIAIAVG